MNLLALFADIPPDPIPPDDTRLLYYGLTAVVLFSGATWFWLKRKRAT